MHYAQRTFQGMYRWNAFDVLLLIPYFAVMVVLAFYGIHRYQLVWLYYRNKQQGEHFLHSAAAVRRGQLPFVTIQLPMYNEQFVLDRLIDACCRIDYPRDRFEIQVLDDSTDETEQVAEDIVQRYATGSGDLPPQPIYYIHRTDRHGYKAGALDAGLALRPRRVHRHLRRRLCPAA